MDRVRESVRIYLCCSVPTYVGVYLYYYVSKLVCTYIAVYLCQCVPMVVCTYVGAYLSWCTAMLVCTYVSVYLCWCIPKLVYSYVGVYLCQCVPMLVCTHIDVYLCYCIPMLVCSFVTLYLYCCLSMLLCTYLLYELTTRTEHVCETRQQLASIKRPYVGREGWGGRGIVVEIWGSLKGVKKLFLPLEKLLQLCTIRITYLLYLLTLRQRLPQEIFFVLVQKVKCSICLKVLNK